MILDHLREAEARLKLLRRRKFRAKENEKRFAFGADAPAARVQLDATLEVATERNQTSPSIERSHDESDEGESKRFFRT